MSKPINPPESVTEIYNKKTEAPDSLPYRESGLWSEAEQEPETSHSNFFGRAEKIVLAHSGFYKGKGWFLKAKTLWPQKTKAL